MGHDSSATGCRRPTDRGLWDGVAGKPHVADLRERRSGTGHRFLLGVPIVATAESGLHGSVAPPANGRTMNGAGNVVDRGLEGVVVGTTAITSIDGATGRLAYRGYAIDDLARNASFEEVCSVLLFGRLPSAAQLGDISVRLAANRALPDALLGMMASLPRDAWPMDVLRTTISGLAAFSPHASGGTHVSNPRSALGLIAKAPTIVAAWDRIRRGLQPLAPLPNLSTAANFLYMRSGRAPSPEHERALDTYLVVMADHSFSASTFAARVAASAHADIYGAVTAALATLHADVHGGVPGAVMAALLEIGSPERADDYVRGALARGERIAGMGHRIYRVRDPRASNIERVARELSELGRPSTYATARALESAAIARLESEKPDRALQTNADFYAAPALGALGLPADEFTCIFACARMAGWTAHVLEQLSDNRLIRPRATYVGAADRPWLPVHERGRDHAATTEFAGTS